MGMRFCFWVPRKTIVRNDTLNDMHFWESVESAVKENLIMTVKPGEIAKISGYKYRQRTRASLRQRTIIVSIGGFKFGPEGREQMILKVDVFEGENQLNFVIDESTNLITYSSCRGSC